MPRDGSNVYSPPGGTKGSPGTTIESSKYNAFVDDLTADANAARPISAGGTGATDASGARDNLGLEIGVDIPAFATTPTKVDVRRNRIVNGDMSVSLEHSNTSGTENGRYPVDQWFQSYVTSAATLTVAQAGSVTPSGSLTRIRATVTVPDASLGAGEYWALVQNIEGHNIRDIRFGGTNAVNLVLRFGFKGPAGTYAVSVQNYNAGTPNRSYIAEFTISAGQANTDTVQEISIPRDTSGIWGVTEGVVGIRLNIVLAAGSNFQGTANTWNAGNVYGTSSTSNGMGTGSAVFELFDVGLKLDPDATGVYGVYEAGQVDPVFRCERYLIPVKQGLGYTLGATVPYSGTVSFPVKAAKAPTLLRGTYTVGGGPAGTVALSTASGAVTEFGAAFSNSAANWSTGVFVSVDALLSARLS